MKVLCHRCAAVVLATALSLPFSPSAWAAPPDHRDGGTPVRAVIRVIKKIQKVFGIHILEDLPTPPKP
jgi:hypothetical protein